MSGLRGHWQLSERTKLSLLCISENATYRADDPERDAPLVIRVHRPGYHTRAEIESELHWLNALRADDVVHTVCPTAIRDGSLLTAFEQDGELRYVVAFEFMSGTELDESGNLTARFRQLGEITARLHQHAKHWHRSTAPSPVRSMNEPSSNECAVTSLEAPKPQERLCIDGDGLVVLELKRAFSDGTTHVLFEPQDFIARLAALVPRPKAHLVRYHGLFAPNARVKRPINSIEPAPHAIRSGFKLW